MTRTPRTLLFCTSYSSDLDAWNARYRLWLDHCRRGGVFYDRLIVVDDGSPMLPDWPDLPAYPTESIPDECATESLHHFTDRLGIVEGDVPLPFPGWYRSFGHAIRYAAANGFDRVVHIESDSYLITARAYKFFNMFDRGWAALWCPLHRWPESALQIINSDQMAMALRFFDRPYSEHGETSVQPIERALPLTYVNRELVGDRYGEIGDTIPFGADFASQVHWGDNGKHLWWLGGQAIADPEAVSLFDRVATYRAPYRGSDHFGVDYHTFLSFLSYQLAPRSFFEIGTETGETLGLFDCDAACVDPAFTLSRDAIKARERLLLFQMTSDQFFLECDLSRYLSVVDIALLDGLHHFEVLLRDFMNLERHAHRNTLVLLHDCFPLNERMTNRRGELGPDSEPEATRAFWTGDVWKIVHILREQRPDLSIVGVDCPPTGLLLVSNLDPRSAVLADRYAAIVAENERLTLAEHDVRKLWTSVPMLDSRSILIDPASFCRAFALRPV